jgi:hypothetical protein
MEISIPISSVMKNVTCTAYVAGIKTWKVRLAAGIWLFKLAAWVTGMKVEVKVAIQGWGK